MCEGLKHGGAIHYGALRWGLLPQAELSKQACFKAPQDSHRDIRWVLVQPVWTVQKSGEDALSELQSAAVGVNLLNDTVVELRKAVAQPHVGLGPSSFNSTRYSNTTTLWFLNWFQQNCKMRSGDWVSGLWSGSCWSSDRRLSGRILELLRGVALDVQDVRPVSPFKRN